MNPTINNLSFISKLERKEKAEEDMKSKMKPMALKK